MTYAQPFSQMIDYQNHEELSYFLKPEGEHILLHGSHEARVWAALQPSGIPKSAQEIMAAVGQESAKIGQGKALQLKWIKKEGSGFVKAA
jgi:phenylalanyl-tRNA synthetase alpha chain